MLVSILLIVAKALFVILHAALAALFTAIYMQEPKKNKLFLAIAGIASITSLLYVVALVLSLLTLYLQLGGETFF